MLSLPHEHEDDYSPDAGEQDEDLDEHCNIKRSFNIEVGIGTSEVIATSDTGATVNPIPCSLLIKFGYYSMVEMRSRLSMDDG